MTQEEEQDLQKHRREACEIMQSAFSAMRSCLRMSPEELETTGYKTKEAAVVGHYKFAQSKLDKLTKEYLAKYPD